jgi:O-antigen/teichoic acid export membrane protein
MPTSEAVVEAAPSMTKNAGRSTAYLAGSLASGNLIAMGLRMIGGLVVLRFVSVDTLGLFNSIGLALGYAPVMQLGIINGLNRELPFYFGKGETNRVRELAAAAQAWAIVVGLTFLAALMCIAIWQLAHGQMWKAAGWFTYGLLGFIYFYSTMYIQMTFRSSQDFVKLAWANVLENSVALVSVAFVALFSFYGLCLRLLISRATAAFMLYRYRPVRVRPKWNLRQMKHLLIIGAPIFGAGAVYGWWGGVVNSTLILKFLGTHGVGLWAPVLIEISALETLPSALEQVIYPRMAEAFGRGRSMRDLNKIAHKPIIYSALGMIPIVVVSWLLMGVAVRLVVPHFVAAVPALRWALLLPIATCFQSGNSIFNVARRQDLYVTAVILGIAAYAITLWLLIRDSVYLAAFPQAMLVGRIVFVLACQSFRLRLQNGESRANAA